MHVQGRRLVAFAVSAAVVVSVAPERAIAHTELEFSLPANGTTVGAPVEEITVGFTDLVALVGNGFEVHDPQGNLLTPFVVTDDNMEFKFQLDPPLAGGVVVVDYHIRALDGDEQQGSFSFTVAVPLQTTTPTSPATDAPVTSPPPSSPGTTSPPTTDAATTDATTTVPAVIAPAPTAALQSTTPATTLRTDDSDGDSERTLMFAVLLGVAALAAGFLVIRSRRTA